MRSLFFKIFLAVWLSQTLVVTVVYGVISAEWQLALQRNSGRWRDLPPVPSSAKIAGYAREAARSAGDAGSSTARQSAQRYLDRLQRDAGLRAVLFDAGGNEVSGREAPGRAAELAERALKSGATEFMVSRSGLLAAQRAGNKPYFVFVTEMPRPGGGRPQGPPRNRRWVYEIMRLLGIFIPAGLVALGLARYLSAPTARLRRVTRQLASGDLSARVGAEMGGRRDELAELGRDFDLMAGRIESLVLAERRLLGDISHELRSPLARLRVALDLALQSADPETRRFLDRIDRESERLNGLIGQLLTLTRLESAGAEAGLELVDLAPLVKEIAADADFEARTNDRTVEVVAAEECRITGSVELVRSAIENVVRNAVRYTPAGTRVEIALRREPAPAGAHADDTSCENPARTLAVIGVRDYGPGVPEETLPNLFRPFFRVADARDRQSGGVGLGLSITARAVRFHRGQVRASNAPDGGLLIEISLPLAEPG
jgi:two-component system sensor histidine kinase CpxA